MSNVQTHASEPHGLGTLLRRAREAAGLSQVDLARQINLAANMVEAMEQEDLAALPSPVYVHGYLRKWAEYLQLDETQLRQAYTHLNGTQVKNDMRHVAPIEPMRMKKAATGFPWGKLVLFVVIVGLGFASIHFWPESMRWMDTATESVSLEPQTNAQDLPILPSIPLALPPPMAERPAAAPTVARVPGIVVGEVIEHAPSLIPPSAQVNDKAKASPSLDLELVGQGSAQGSWVRVKDADGSTLFEGVISPGKRKHVLGKRPFEVMVGQASDLSIHLDGQSVDLNLYARPGGKAFIPKLGSTPAQ